MGSVTITINVVITGGNSVSPMSTIFEVNVLDVGPGVNNIHINTLTSLGLVDVFVECTEVKALPVRETSKAPWGRMFSNWLLESENLRVLLDIGNLRFKKRICQTGRPKRRARQNPEGHVSSALAIRDKTLRDNLLAGTKQNLHQDVVESRQQRTGRKHRNTPGDHPRCCRYV
jgi:hypothetical protein